MSSAVVCQAPCPPGCPGTPDADDGLYCHCRGCGDYAADDRVNGLCARCCGHELWVPGNRLDRRSRCALCGMYRDDLLTDLAGVIEHGDPIPPWTTHTEIFNRVLEMRDA